MPTDGKTTKGKARRKRIAEQARRIVDVEFTRMEGCDTRAIARRLRVSRSRLCHCYREFFGTTIGEDIRERRIRLAARMLTDDPKNLVKEVAAAVGYGRRSYRTFLNSFHKVLGASPREFRRQVIARQLGEELRDEEREEPTRLQSKISSA